MSAQWTGSQIQRWRSACELGFCVTKQNAVAPATKHWLTRSARGPDKGDPGRIQILHYNIERFPDEITDLRGLETLLVTR